jgi:hypothetical protein
MLIGCGCHCTDASELSQFSSAAASYSVATSSIVYLPAKGCDGCMDTVAPTVLRLSIDYTGGDTNGKPINDPLFREFPCCSAYSSQKQYRLKRQNIVNQPGLVNCCYWESDERALMYDQFQPSGQRCVTTTFARAFAVVYSAGDAAISCPYSWALNGGGLFNGGPWFIATGLRFLYKVTRQASDYRSSYIWYSNGNRTLSSSIDCLAKLNCQYTGQYWNNQQTIRKWSSGWMQPYYEPCYSGPPTIASNGIPAAVTLQAVPA